MSTPAGSQADTPSTTTTGTAPGASAQQLVEQVAAEAEATREQPLSAGAPATRPNRSVPVAVRLTPEDAGAVEALAARLQVPTSVLLRGWILTALAAQQQDSLSTAIDRIAADVQHLRELTT